MLFTIDGNNNHSPMKDTSIVSSMFISLTSISKGSPFSFLPKSLLNLPKYT